jgi:hypothetical protein
MVAYDQTYDSQASDDFYLFHHVNDVDFDEKGNLLQTEYVRKLNRIGDMHLKRF